jgi:hypothetical protein
MNENAIDSENISKSAKVGPVPLFPLRESLNQRDLGAVLLADAEGLPRLPPQDRLDFVGLLKKGPSRSIRST